MSGLQLGIVVMTPSVQHWVTDTDSQTRANFLDNCVKRHSLGDWGDICEEDQQENRDAIQYGNRVLSIYNHDSITIWIITEWDRSVTTILLPCEY